MYLSSLMTINQNCNTIVIVIKATGIVPDSYLLVFIVPT